MSVTVDSGNAEGGDEWTNKKMRAWEINVYGEPLTTLQLNCEAPIPKITKPNQVLIRVKASSLNPIDLRMVRGYGSNMMQVMREREKGRYMASILVNRGQQFPLILGRDFAGTVVKVGQQVKEFTAGDHVYGLVAFYMMGSNADYIVVPDDWIQLKPDFLTFPEAASMPNVAMTTYGALKVAGKFTDFTDKSFLLVGDSGGVGTFAIQYLRSQGARVTTTCSGNAIPMLKDLGADFCVDYSL